MSSKSIYEENIIPRSIYELHVFEKSGLQERYYQEVRHIFKNNVDFKLLEDNNLYLQDNKVLTDDNLRDVIYQTAGQEFKVNEFNIFAKTRYNTMNNNYFIKQMKENREETNLFTVLDKNSKNTSGLKLQEFASKHFIHYTKKDLFLEYSNYAYEPIGFRVLDRIDRSTYLPSLLKYFLQDQDYKTPDDVVKVYQTFFEKIVKTIKYGALGNYQLFMKFVNYKQNLLGATSSIDFEDSIHFWAMTLQRLLIKRNKSRSKTSYNDIIFECLGLNSGDFTDLLHKDFDAILKPLYEKILNLIVIRILIVIIFLITIDHFFLTEKSFWLVLQLVKTIYNGSFALKELLFGVNSVLQKTAGIYNKDVGKLLENKKNCNTLTHILELDVCSDFTIKNNDGELNNLVTRYNYIDGKDLREQFTSTLKTVLGTDYDATWDFKGNIQSWKTLLDILEQKMKGADDVIDPYIEELKTNFTKIKATHSDGSVREIETDHIDFKTYFLNEIFPTIKSTFWRITTTERPVTSNDESGST